MHVILFDVGSQPLKRKIRKFIFSGKIVTSLAMDKSPTVKIIFDRKSLICRPIFNFLWHLLRLLGFKKMIQSHFAVSVSEQGDMQKGKFPKDCVRTVIQ